MIKMIFILQILFGILNAENIDIFELNNFKVQEGFVKGRVGTIEKEGATPTVLDWTEDKRYFEPAVMALANISLLEGKLLSFFATYVYTQEDKKFVRGIVCNKIQKKDCKSCKELREDLQSYECFEKIEQLKEK